MSGECEAVWDGAPWKATYEIGTYHSGRTRVYEGVFTRIGSDDGREWVGHDRWSYVEALKRLFERMTEDGLHLVAAGLDERFYTTGLSDGSGYGYVSGMEDEGLFHIFAQVE